jgi:small-conductance mechanosensitive channel
MNIMWSASVSVNPSSTQQHFLHFVLCSCFFLLAAMALAVVAIATGFLVHAHRRAEVLKKGNTILATEVLKLDLLEVGVEVHAFALWVVAALSSVQEFHQNLKPHKRYC